MLFGGTFRHTIDAKNRLAIPLAFRRQLEQPGVEKAFVARPVRKTEQGLTRRYLELMMVGDFQAGTDFAGTERKLNLSAREADLLDATYADVATLTLDSQNRVLIPEDVMLKPGQDDPFHKRFLGVDVYVVGNRDRICVWNASEYIDYRAQRDQILAAGSAAAGQNT